MHLYAKIVKHFKVVIFNIFQIILIHLINNSLTFLNMKILIKIVYNNRLSKKSPETLRCTEEEFVKIQCDFLVIRDSRNFSLIIVRNF